MKNKEAHIISTMILTGCAFLTSLFTMLNNTNNNILLNNVITAICFVGFLITIVCYYKEKKRN